MESFKICFASPENFFCIRRPNLALESLELIFSNWEDSIWAFDKPENKFIGKSNIAGKFLEIFKVASFSQKNDFVFFGQIWHCKALNQYSMALRIGFRLLTNLKTSLYEKLIYGESFWGVLSFASLSQKTCFLFVDQIWHYKTLNQYSMAPKIGFRLFTDFEANL